MDRRVADEATPLLTAAVGALLFVAAASHHLTEISRIGQRTGPILAFALDGLPALGLVYGGYHLDVRGDRPAHGWRVFLSTLAGGAVGSGVIGLSVLVRLWEGRVVGEVGFELLLATTTGSIAGFLAGYYASRAVENAREATQVLSTLSFTNSVLRHDIKNDMTVVRGYAEVIADTEPEDELVADAARTIDDRVERVLGTIESTGAIAEALSEDPQFTPVDLTEIVADVVAHADDSRAATVTADLPEHAEILANEAVRPVVSNLVENGAEHNDAEDPRVHVTVESTTESVRLRVLDNGPGIPDAAKRDLFEPRREGIDEDGLHVVKTLADNFGADVRVEDNEPRGTAFVVDFPRP